MAKQIEGVSENIIAAAKQEFLEKGYVDASLRTIASAAGTSTNSIYVRFGDKEGLFSAIVEPVLNEMVERFLKIQERFHQMSPDEQAAQMPEYSDGGTAELVDYMYENLDEFRLLLDASQGFTILLTSWCVSKWNIPINTWRLWVIPKNAVTLLRKNCSISSRHLGSRVFLR